MRSVWLPICTWLPSCSSVAEVIATPLTHVPALEPASSMLRAAAVAAGGDARVLARHRRVGEHDRAARRAPDRHVAHERHARLVREHELERLYGSGHRGPAVTAVVGPLRELTTAARAEHGYSSVRGWKAGLSPMNPSCDCALGLLIGMRTIWPAACP